MDNKMKAHLRRSLNLLIKNKLVRTKGGLTKALRAMMETADNNPGMEALAKKAGIDFDKESFTLKQLEQGFKVELEHVKDKETKVTDDPVDVIKIAWAHLKENKDYYKKLKQMETEMKKSSDAINIIKNTVIIDPNGKIEHSDEDSHTHLSRRLLARNHPEHPANKTGGSYDALDALHSLGYLSLGHGADWNIAGHKKILHDPSNPATISAKRLIASQSEKREYFVDLSDKGEEESYRSPFALVSAGNFKRPSEVQMYRSEALSNDLEKSIPSASFRHLVPAQASSPSSVRDIKTYKDVNKFSLIASGKLGGRKYDIYDSIANNAMNPHSYGTTWSNIHSRREPSIAASYGDHPASKVHENWHEQLAHIRKNNSHHYREIVDRSWGMIHPEDQKRIGNWMKQAYSIGEIKTHREKEEAIGQLPSLMHHPVVRSTAAGHELEGKGRMLPDDVRGRKSWNDIVEYSKNLKPEHFGKSLEKAVSGGETYRYDSRSDQPSSKKEAFHGWISPEGEFHKMHPGSVHFKYAQHLIDTKGIKQDFDPDITLWRKGWISTGHGGGSSVTGSKETLHDPNHPATKKLAEMFKETPSEWIHVFVGDEGGYADKIPRHLAEHGEFRPEAGKYTNPESQVAEKMNAVDRINSYSPKDQYNLSDSYYKKSFGKSDATDDIKSLENKWNNDKRVALVSLFTSPDEKKIHLHGIAVKDVHQKQGIGKQIIGEIHDVADKHGYTVHLKSFPKTHEYYSGLGYSVDEFETKKDGQSDGLKHMVRKPSWSSEGLGKSEKEPWEMTYGELRNAVTPSNRAELQNSRKTLRAVFPEQLKDETDPWGIKRAVERGDELPRTFTSDLSVRHRQHIKQALAAGNSVPNHVLAEYPDLSITKSSDTIDLEHWSTTSSIDTIDPNKHGKGIRGQESERKAAFPDSFVPRSYFYSAGTEPEKGLGPHKHSVSVPKGQIYDLSKDPQGFFDKTSPQDPYLHRLNQTERAVRNSGYRGAYLGRMGGEYKDKGHGHVYMMFHPERVQKDLQKAEDKSNFNKPSPKITADSLSHGHHGPFSMISAERKELSPEENAKRTKELGDTLRAAGHHHIPIMGNYDNVKEKSFVVMGPHQKEIERLGQQYDQESVIHSHNGSHEMHYISGEHAGKFRPGIGHKMKPNDEKSDYSEHEGQKFSLNFDWDKLHDKGASSLSKYMNVNDLFKARKNALPPDQIMYILKHGNDQDRANAMLFYNDTLNEDHLRVALKDKLALVRNRAAQNPKFSSDMIDESLRSEKNLGVIRTIFAHPNFTQQNIDVALERPELYDHIVDLPDLTPQHIDRLMNSDNHVVREEAAKHPNASPENLRKVVDAVEGEKYSSEDLSVAAAALRNPNATADILSRAIDVAGTNPYGYQLYSIIASHPKFNTDHITKMVDIGGEASEHVSQSPLLTEEHVDKILKVGGHSATTNLFRNPRSERHITQALHSPFELVRIKAILNANVTPEHIAIAMKDEDHRVRALAVENPKATKEQAEAALADPVNDVVDSALKHKEISAKALKNIIKTHRDEGIRGVAVSHDNCDEDCLSIALDDRSSQVRHEAVINKNLSSKNIDQAIRGNNISVASSAAQHPNATSENLTNAIGTGNSHLARSALLNKNHTSDHVEQAIKASSKYQDWKDKARVQVVAASSPEATQEQLSKLLDWDDADVSSAAAKNENLASTDISKILSNPDKYGEGVSVRAMNNPNHGPEHVGIAMNHPTMVVRMYAASSKHATPEQLDALMNDNDAVVRNEARKNNNISSDQIQKMIDSGDRYAIRQALDRRNITVDHLKDVLKKVPNKFQEATSSESQIVDAVLAHPKATPEMLVTHGNFTGEKEFKGRSMVYSHIKDRIKAFGKEHVSKQEYTQKHPEDKALPELQKIFRTGKAGVANVDDARSEEAGMKYLTSEGQWSGSQRHSDVTERVFRFDIHPDQYNKYSEEDKHVLGAVMRDAQTSAHPVNPSRPTIGWARVDTSNPDHWKIDEMQSDIGKKLKTAIYQQAQHRGAEVPSHVAEAATKFAEDFKDFGHHMLAHVMEEAHKAGVKKVSIHSNASKNTHLGRYDPKKPIVKWTKEKAKEYKEARRKTWNDPDQPVETQTEMYEKPTKPAGFKPTRYKDLPMAGPNDLGKIYTRDVVEKAVRKALVKKAIACGYKVTPALYKAIAGLTAGDREDNLRNIHSKWRSEGVDLYATGSGDTLTLHTLRVPKEKRKQGIGSKVMEDLTSHADTHGQRMILTTGSKADEGTTSSGRLKKFYKRFGFVENKGRNKDYRISENMHRSPQGGIKKALSGGEMWGGGNKKMEEFHGWVSPEGKFHKIPRDKMHGHWAHEKVTGEDLSSGKLDDESFDKEYARVHESERKLVNNGWVATGLAGHPEIYGHKDVVNNSSSPQMSTIRNLAKKHLAGHSHLTINGERKISIDNFIKTGNANPSGVALYRSDAENEDKGK